MINGVLKTIRKVGKQELVQNALIIFTSGAVIGGLTNYAYLGNKQMIAAEPIRFAVAVVKAGLTVTGLYVAFRAAKTIHKRLVRSNA